MTKKLDALKRSHADLSNRFTESKNDSVEWQRKYEVELEKNRQLNIAMQNERAEYESTIQDRDRMVEETQLSRTSQARESRDLYERKVKALEESHNTKLSDVKQQNRSLIEERKKKETEMQRKLNLQEEEIVRLAEQLKSANSSLEIELDRFKKVSTENAELKYKLEVSKRDCERTAERAKYSANISIFKENSFKETIEELTADKEALQKEKETLESIVIKLKVQISELKRKSGESGSDSGTEQRKAIRDLEKKVKMSEKEIKETKDKLKAKEQE